MARQFVRSSGEYLSLGAGLGLSPPFSVAARIQLASLSAGAADCVFSMGIPNQNSGHELLILPTGTVRVFSINAGAFNGANSSVNLAAGNWYNLQGSWDATNSRKVWVDGANSGTNATSVSNFTATETEIGHIQESPVNKLFDGLIEYVAVWSAPMTDTEALLISKGLHPLAVKSFGLVEFWDLTRNLMGVRGNALTPTGTTVVENSGFVFPRPGRNRSRIFVALPAGITGQIQNGMLALSGQTLTSIPTAHMTGQVQNGMMELEGQALAGLLSGSIAGQMQSGSIEVNGQVPLGLPTDHRIGILQNGSILVNGQFLTGLKSDHRTGQIQAGSLTLDGQILTGLPSAHVFCDLQSGFLDLAGQTLTGVEQIANPVSELQSGSLRLTGQLLTGLPTGRKTYLRLLGDPH